MADERERYPPPWRVGSKGKQTIYDASPEGDGGLPGRSLGRMDTPELAAIVVEAVNGLDAAREENERLRAALEDLVEDVEENLDPQDPDLDAALEGAHAALARRDGDGR